MLGEAVRFPCLIVVAYCRRSESRLLSSVLCIVVERTFVVRIRLVVQFRDYVSLINQHSSLDLDGRLDTIELLVLHRQI